jgi:hypothetical protein
MKKCFLFILILIGLKGFSQRFPGTDSLRTYNTKYVTNNPATAFTNLRLHTLLRGIIDWIDTARAGTGGGGMVGVDSIAILNDTTARYRKNGVFKTFILPGRHWVLQGILNNGSVLTNNSTITLADSLFFSSGKTLVDNLRIVNTTQQTDTSTYKPVALDANGNVHKLNRWPGGVVDTRYSITNVLPDNIHQLVNDTSLVTATGRKFNYQLDTTGRRAYYEDKYVVSKNMVDMRKLRINDTSYIFRVNIGGALGDFYYDPNDVATTDDSVMTIVSAAGHRYKRYNPDLVYDVRWFGAKCDGTIFKQ